MVRRLAILTFSVISLVIPSQASVLLFSENFEGIISPKVTGGSGVIDTTGAPIAAAVATRALNNRTGGSPEGTPSELITLQLTGLAPNSAAFLQFTFIAIDSWDGLDFTCCTADFLNVLANGGSAFQATFRNHLATNYTGDGTATYGSTPPANSTITPLATGTNYLTSSDPDSFYDIKVGGFSADAGGNLTISWFASGAGWQGGDDESFAIDNILVNGDLATASGVPEPGTWLTLSAGFAGLLAWRRRRT